MSTPFETTVEVADTIKTLHVDDDTAFGELTAELLEESNARLEIVTEATVAAGLERVEVGEVDCIVSDYDLPGQNGIDFLQQVRDIDPDIPFILFTGKGSEEVASEAVSKGVTDYLQKEYGTEQYTVLANRIVNLAEKARTETDLDQRKQQHEAVATLGQTALTADSLETLFDEAVELVAERLGACCTKVLELRPDHGDFLLVAGVGWHDGVVGTRTISATENTQASYTLTNAEPVVVTDLTSESGFDGPDLLTSHGIKSGVSVIIGSPDDPWGVFGVHTTDKRRFTEHDVAFVQNVANVLASAIEQRRTEQQLRESETRFREIAELSPDGIFRTDTEGVFTYVSPASEELLSRESETLVGRRFDEVVAPESKAAAAEGIERVIDGEVVRDLSLTLVDGDGKPVEVELSASPVRRDGDVAFVQGFARDVTDRIEHERALQASTERFEALVDLFPNGGVFLFDEDFQFTMVGGDELEAVGLIPEQMLGKAPSELFSAELAADFERRYRAALDGEPQSFEYSFQGEEYHVQTVPLKNADGEIISGMAVAQNITARVEREKELRAIQERFQALIDNFPGGVLRFDTELRIMAAGGVELERAGWNPKELAGQRLEDVLPPEVFEALEPHYRATLDGEKRSFEYESDGDYYHIQTIPLRNGDGEVQSMMSVAQNVTERVEHDRKLDRLRERTQALMNTQTVEETARVAVDAALDVIGAPLSGVHTLNDAGDRLEPVVLADAVHGLFDTPPAYRRDAEPGSRAAIAWEVFERDEPLYVPDSAAYDPLNEPSPTRSALLHPLGDHGLFVVSSSEPDAYDETDRTLVDILVASLTAALDRVKREQRLRERETRLERQNERLSRFARVVSHDLRSPLSVAGGRLSLARMNNESETVEEQLQAVADAHGRMEDLIESLLGLTLSEGETTANREVSLKAIAEASWQAVETTDERLVVDTERTVTADEHRLRQLFENLFRNSVEHGSTGSRPTPDDSVERGSTSNRSQAGDSVEHSSTGSRPTPDDSVERGSTSNRPEAGDSVEHGTTDDQFSGRPLTVTVGELNGRDGFFVEDDGAGIPAETRGRVFEAGYSTTDSGIGFGLSIVMEIAIDHGWTVSVTDAESGGARFEFEW